MADSIQVSFSGRIATITINNEKKLGALTGDGYYAIAKAMREIAERDDIFITVLTGKGRYFSAYVLSLSLFLSPLHLRNPTRLIRVLHTIPPSQQRKGPH